MKKREEAKLLALEALQTKLPDNLFAEPVEYVFADHYRQRTLCALLDDIANSESLDLQIVEAVLNFLKSEFGLHVLDEEEDLFPLLRQRAEPEDEINTVLEQLSQEHANNEGTAHDIVKILEQFTETKERTVMRDDAVRLLKRFAANERRHLIVENAIVLPLARVRLTEEDCKQLGQRMAARRGANLDD